MEKTLLVNSFLTQSAERFPDKKAVWFKDNWLTFSQIEVKSNQLANYLKSRGINRGDRVALILENSFNYIIAYYAILKAGAVTVALNTETKSDGLIYLLNDSEAKAIISQKRFSKELLPALNHTPYLKEVIVEHTNLDQYKDIGHCNTPDINKIFSIETKENPGVRSIDIDVASIVYTSGSTGKPKGVVLTHQNILANTKSIVEYLKLTSEDRIMVVLPFYYIYGKSLLNTHFAVGGSVVIDNRFAFPNSVLETMKKTEVTGLSGVPSTFMILLNKSSIRDYTFEKLRYVTQAGGAMAPAIQKEVTKVFSPADLFIMYGATEASARLSYLDPKDLPKKWGSIGKAIPNVDLFVADETGKPMPPNQEGQIVARGSNMMQGYWNDLEETTKVLKNGLYYTGDIGTMDEEGFLYVVGRTKDMIKVGGERISAKSVEEIILEIKEVHEVAVIGVEDELLGEAVKAFVVISNDAILEEQQILKHCKSRLPQYKIPKYIEFIDSLPKNESGKVLKEQLRRMTSEERGA
jgi:acyl-CoA synthetase (AMP-forming)/AMP-acid ligase II